VSKIDCEELHQVLEVLKKDELQRIAVLEVINARGSLDLHRLAASLPRLEVLEVYYSTAVHVSVRENFQVTVLRCKKASFSRMHEVFYEDLCFFVYRFMFCTQLPEPGS
jgi:hypothetical protein